MKVTISNKLTIEQLEGFFLTDKSKILIRNRISHVEAGEIEFTYESEGFFVLNFLYAFKPKVPKKISLPYVSIVPKNIKLLLSSENTFRMHLGINELVSFLILKLKEKEAEDLAKRILEF